MTANRNRVVALTEHEGGYWIPVPMWRECHTGKQPAAVMFEDGAVYDHVIEKRRAEGRTTVSPWRHL